MIQTHNSLIITNAYLTFPSKGYILIVKSKVKNEEQTIIKFEYEEIQLKLKVLRLLFF